MTEHPGDLLSALLDGQLSDSDATAVRAHVDACSACEAELDDVRAARRLVRELPAVEPAAWFVREMLAGDDVIPLGRRGAAASIAASVAAGVLLLLLSATNIGPSALEPEVAGAVERHASTVSALLGSTGETRLTPGASVVATTAPRRDAERLPAPYDAPSDLAGYRLVDAYRSPGGVHLLYEDDGFGLSVFELPGDVDWGALPADEGTQLRIAGHRAWRWDAHPAKGRLVVMEDDGMVVIVVGDEPGDAVLDVASALPSARSLPMQTKVRRAIARTLEQLSPVG